MRARPLAIWTCATLALVAIGGCGEKVDELGPYVEKLHEVDAYNAKLVEYRQYLKADQQEKASGVAQTIEAYLADMKTFGQTHDKMIMAGHNALKRDLEHALNKIVQPDFPTFTISALKQIDIIEEGYRQHVTALKRLWEEDAHPGEFTLAWPEPVQN